MKLAITITIIGGIALAGCMPALSTSMDRVAVASVAGTTGTDISSTVENSNYDTKEDAIASAKATAGAVGESLKEQAQEAGAHAENLNESAKDGFYQSVDHIAGWLAPSKPKPPRPIAASYCYHVYQDTLCYRQPMPGWETRLAGYQPLGVEPPAPAMMQPMPKHVLDASQLPANRVASSKPVFSQLPQAPADAGKAPEDGTAPAAVAAPDATHEQLPDPALAPQL